MQRTTKDKEIEKEIKELIHKKLCSKGIPSHQRIEMNGGGVYLENLLFDFAVSFRRQERYKIKREIGEGIENLKEY